jgi:hypothetical protein
MEMATIMALTAASMAAEPGKAVLSEAAKDLWGKFKAVLSKRFGGKSDLENAVKQVEEKPEAAGRQKMLEAELEASGAAKDEEILGLAKQLAEALKESGIEITQSGEGVIVTGDGSAGAGKGGAAVAGDVHGDITIDNS